MYTHKYICTWEYMVLSYKIISNIVGLKKLKEYNVIIEMKNVKALLNKKRRRCHFIFHKAIILEDLNILGRRAKSLKVGSRQ